MFASTTSLQSVPQSMTVVSPVAVVLTPVTEPLPEGLTAAVSVHRRMKFAVTVRSIGAVHCAPFTPERGQPLQ